MGQNGDLEWQDGVPVSRRFADPYFSREGGLDETRHTFLAGSDLPGRFVDGFRIAELGFGTGLNLLAAILAWGEQPGRFSFTSFEAFPLEAGEMERALAAFPEVARPAGALARLWRSGARRGPVGPADVTIVVGDARQTLPAWEGQADAWFLDGFAPARNPELWGEALMGEVARHTAQGGSFATYTAAGEVRRALEAAGFDVERLPGYGRKRHMTRGWLRLR